MRKSTASSSPGVIHMRDVVKTFVNSAGEFTALRGVDLDLEGGEFVSLIGKSGSGKSTLLNMLTGIDHPTSGEVLVNGVDIHALSESKRSQWRGRNLGVVFQFFQLLPTLNLLENVMLPMDYLGAIEIDQRPKRALELLDMVGLRDQAQQLPRAVSRGQQQGAAIARALANDAPILVADEPTGNLDSRSAAHIYDLFEELSRGGKTIIMVTHDPSLTQRTSRTLYISDGQLVDETIAQALPYLSHASLQELERRVEPLSFKPGETILEQGQEVDSLYLIKKGQVEVRRSALEGKVDATLSANEIFGEQELFEGVPAGASYIASPTEGATLLVLPRVDFHWLLGESPLIADYLMNKNHSQAED